MFAADISERPTVLIHTSLNNNAYHPQEAAEAL